ncbi:excisionase family DNA-binding protein [Roseobacter sp. HKCCA2468]|uniref:excisionase family DNA-binding protein n=1 Tax=Roseobacter sp. HKCCA2468 TaxID=3120342 RepID=UPI0030EE92C8
MTRSDTKNLTTKDLTTVQVARALGVATGTVQKMVDIGVLEAWKTGGGHRRITRDSLEQYLKNHLGDKIQHHGAKSETTANKKILVIEDSHFYSEMLKTLAMNSFPDGFVSVCYDAFSAIDELKRGVPDLILLDLGLPDMDGVALLTRIALIDREYISRLIVVTGNTSVTTSDLPEAYKNIPIIYKDNVLSDLPKLFDKINIGNY